MAGSEFLLEVRCEEIPARMLQPAMRELATRLFEELMALNRDYQNVRESYSSLLNRKLEAEVAVNMEKTHKGEQFSILQSAQVPLGPISPNIKILFMLAVMGSVSIGFGLIFLLDYFDTSLKDPDEFELDLGLSVLATIPKVYEKKDFRLKRLSLHRLLL